MARRSSKRSKAEKSGRSAKLERLRQEFELHESVGTEDRFEYDRDSGETGRPERKKSRKERKQSDHFRSDTPEEQVSNSEKRPAEDKQSRSTGTKNKETSGRRQKNSFGQIDQNSGETEKTERSDREAKTDTGTFDGRKQDFSKREEKGAEGKATERKINLKKARQRREAVDIYEKENKAGDKAGEGKKPEELYKEARRDFHENPPEFKGDRGNFDFEGVEKTDGLSPKDRQKLKYYRKKSEKYHKKADKLEKKLPKEVELKYVTDKNGESRLVLRKKTKDEKDIKSSSRRSMVKKANKEIFERTWKKDKEEKEKKKEYTSDDNAEDVFDLGKESAERLFDIKDFVADSKSSYQKRKYDEFNKAEDKAFKADADLKYEKDRLFKSDPEVNKAESKHALQKEVQKRRIKKNYAKEFRENAKKAKEVAGAGEAAASGIKNVGDVLSSVKAFFTGGSVAPLFIAIGIITIIIVLFFMVFGSLFVAGGSVAAVVTSTYLSNMDDIDAAEVYFTKLETDLQKSLDEEEFKKEHPEYDAVDIVISGEISHNPYTLISYLSAVHGVFEYNSDLESEIEELFNKCYEVVETSSGGLYQVNVQAKTLEEVIPDLMDDLSKGLYYLYSLSHGLVQVFATPCNYYWGMLISKNYGYQQNPETGDIEYHNGITISVPLDTEVYAGINGSVTETGDSAEYGEYVVIYDGEHYTAKYGFLTDLRVSPGDEVKAGDIIGISAEDEDSISGSSIYLECQYDGTYYNPCFLFAGYFGEEDIIKDLGIPTDATSTETTGSIDLYEEITLPEETAPEETAMYETNAEAAQTVLFPESRSDSTGNSVIDEGMKWLGKPYLFSGSNPETGIDCSGFIDWCFEKSGVRPGLPHSCVDLYDECIPVAAEDLRVGDLVFFQGTYKKGISHVGIYCGNGEMLHAGDPIQITSLTKQYYQKHFFGYGRIV